MRIALDVMGGDHGPEVIIQGAIAALGSVSSVEEIVLVGRQDEIEPILDRLWPKRLRIRVAHASEVLEMAEKPVYALRRKKDCSLLRAVEQVKAGLVDAVISPGNTGAMVAASTIRLRPLSGIERPGIATVIPTQNGRFVLIDSGANVDPRPIHLFQYALMGTIFAKESLGLESPRVGLLSVGSEPSKGNELTLEAFKSLEKSGINFIGNIEGYDLFHNRVDVVVCDGFVGNVTLKTCEGLARGIMGWIKAEMTRTLWRKIPTLMLKPAFRPIRRELDPDTHGGGFLLGLNGSVMIAHGGASAKAIENAISIVASAVGHGIDAQIQGLVTAEQGHQAR